jgi:crossover junction endodeoxyribonuclease RusA
MQIEFPWPPKTLSPNARVHWAKKSKAAKSYRGECYILTKQAGLKIDWDGDIHAWIDFYPPDRRRRDDDNMVSSFKSGRDGMADALRIDDSRIRIHPYVKSATGGKIVVTLTAGTVQDKNN